MKIIPYSPEYRDEFVELNRLGYRKCSSWSPEDERELSNIEGYIQAGGQIFFALDDDGAVMACCMIGPREDGDWEIMKFAAKGMYTRNRSGECLP